MTELKPCNLIFASGQKILLSSILDFIFKIKKLNYKDFIKIDKKFFRKNEIKNITCNIDTTILKLKKFKWKPKIYGKKLTHKIYNNL